MGGLFMRRTSPARRASTWRVVWQAMPSLTSRKWKRLASGATSQPAAPFHQAKRSPARGRTRLLEHSLDLARGFRGGPGNRRAEYLTAVNLKGSEVERPGVGLKPCPVERGTPGTRVGLRMFLSRKVLHPSSQEFFFEIEAVSRAKPALTQFHQSSRMG
jgi:hypothetical protein